MKKGCLGSLILLALATGGHMYLFQQRELTYPWWAAFLLALGIVITIANIFGIKNAILMSRALNMIPAQWRDGALVGVSGRLSPIGQPIVAPFSGAPSLIYEYRVGRRHSQPNTKTNAADVMQAMTGEGMAPCAVQGQHGSIRLVGFPILHSFPPSKFDTEAALKRAGAYIKETTWKRGAGGVSGSLKELSELLSDADGIVKNDRVVAHLPFELKMEGDPIPADGTEDDEEADKEALEDVPLEAMTPEHYTQQLKSRRWAIEEKSIAPGSEVTAFGTYRTNPVRLDVGSGLTYLTHGLHAGRREKVKLKNIVNNVIAFIVWGAITAAGHAFVYFPHELADLSREHLGWSWEKAEE